MRKGSESGQIAVCAVINGQSLKNQRELAEKIVEKVPEVVSFTVNINRNRNNVIMGTNVRRFTVPIP